jgi:hypothetical protein
MSAFGGKSGHRADSSDLASSGKENDVLRTRSGWSSIRLLIYVKGWPTNWIKKLVVNFIQTRFEREAYPHTGACSAVSPL